MKRPIGLALFFAFAAQPLWAQHHGGGHHGGGHSSGGHSGGHSSGGHFSGGHHGGGHHGGGHYGGGHRSGGLHLGLFGGHHYGHGYAPRYYGYYGGYYSRPYYYGGYYPYAYGYAGSYGGSSHSSVRVLVEPAETRVYVDGYYAGSADDFDGAFQRMRLDPGRHEIVLSLEGYRTARFDVYGTPGHTVKLHHLMARGAGDDEVGRLGDPGSGGEPARPGPYAADRALGLREMGTLLLRVAPADAVVYVDGKFRGTAREAGQLDLPPGRHRIEIVRPGLRTFEREVEIDARATALLEADLER